MLGETIQMKYVPKVEKIQNGGASAPKINKSKVQDSELREWKTGSSKPTQPA